MSAPFTFTGEKLKKSFMRKTIFSDISFSLCNGESLTVSGRNGSGKSTLLRVLASLHGPSAGKVTATIAGKEIPKSDHFMHMGFVAPYLQLYEEFTAWENLQLLKRIRNIDVSDERMNALLEKVQLFPRRHDAARTYSSGMKQRLKYACALLHGPILLMLDEPTANLDTAGRELVEGIVKEQQDGGIVIVATNEPQEVAWCRQLIDLDARKEALRAG